MANPFFEPPATPGGTAEEQLRQVYSYLYQMSEKLNESLNAVTMDQMETGLRETIRTAGEAGAKSESNYTTLKSLIIKTAEIVRSEMDLLRVNLESKYTAISDQFGTFEQNLSNEVEISARGVMQSYGYDERIEASENFIVESRQYIFTGLLEEATGTQGPKYGVAVGLNVTDENGELVDGNKFATFTAEELAFYVNGNKTAWFSNNTMYIDRGQLVKSLQMGNHEWRILAGGSLALINYR